jgi:hypothetical protein
LSKKINFLFVLTTEYPIAWRFNVFFNGRVMDENLPTQLFKSRRQALASYLSLAGAGLNLTSQVAPLCALGVEALGDLRRINILSSSVFSYLITQAHISEDLKLQNLSTLDMLSRQIYGVGTKQYLARLIPTTLTRSAFFSHQQIGEVAETIFGQRFLNSTLANLPQNLCFWAYCTKKGTLTEISIAQGFGDLPIWQLIRVCTCIPKLHGSYPYKNRAFIDPLYSPAARQLLAQIAAIKGNHLIINSNKNEDTNTGTLYLNALGTPPKPHNDYLRFMCNRINSRIEDAQQQALSALKNWPLVRYTRPPRPKTQLVLDEKAASLENSLYLVDLIEQ